jgi:hypothetical protein
MSRVAGLRIGSTMLEHDGRVTGSDGPTPADAPAPEADAPPVSLPPDPAAYDSPRNAAARARGLPYPYIPGGDDPDPVTGLEEERHYGRLLLIMVGVIVFGGFILGIIGMIVGGVIGA